MMSEFCFFFFKQKTAYEMRISDWSSDVCSSDLDSSVPDKRFYHVWAIASDMHIIFCGRRSFCSKYLCWFCTILACESSSFFPSSLVVTCNSQQHLLSDMHDRVCASSTCHSCIRLFHHVVRAYTICRTWYGKIGRASCRESVCQYV